ncbi:MAG: hypothetical protein FWE65_00940, partial [Eggerthellaceae bacterium]|nr:hypothetical protein [Eggerthellaceae bacterium]
MYVLIDGKCYFCPPDRFQESLFLIVNLTILVPADSAKRDAKRQTDYQGQRKKKCVSDPLYARRR